MSDPGSMCDHGTVLPASNDDGPHAPEPDSRPPGDGVAGGPDLEVDNTILMRLTVQGP